MRPESPRRATDRGGLVEEARRRRTTAPAGEARPPGGAAPALIRAQGAGVQLKSATCGIRERSLPEVRDTRCVKQTLMGVEWVVPAAMLMLLFTLVFNRFAPSARARSLPLFALLGLVSGTFLLDIVAMNSPSGTRDRHQSYFPRVSSGGGVGGAG